jgi:hypothetical protein
VYTTYRGLKDPRIYELNPILGKKPSLSELIILKIVWGGFVLKAFTTEELIIPNTLTTYAVVNNIDVLHSVGVWSL